MAHDNLTCDDLFQCKQCGDCCTGYGGTYVTAGDIRAISKFLGKDPETFVDEYCQMSGKRPVLKLAQTGKCTFFDPEKQCTIHAVKPKMCRAWPFIETILNAPGNWEIMGQACPGIITGFPHDAVQGIVKKEVDRLKELRKDLDKEDNQKS